MAPTLVNQLDRLNERQESILFLVSKGLHNSEIAVQMGLSARTIKWYVSQLLLIFEASNRTELVGLFASDFPPRTTKPRRMVGAAGRPRSA